MSSQVEKKIKLCIEKFDPWTTLAYSKNRDEILKNMEKAATGINDCYIQNNGRTWDLRFDLSDHVADNAKKVFTHVGNLTAYPMEDAATAFQTQALIKAKSDALTAQYAPLWKAIPSFWNIVREDAPVLAWGGLAAMAGGLVNFGVQVVKTIKELIPKGPPMILIVPWEELDPSSTGPPA